MCAKRMTADTKLLLVITSHYLQVLNPLVYMWMTLLWYLLHPELNYIQWLWKPFTLKLSLLCPVKLFNLATSSGWLYVYWVAQCPPKCKPTLKDQSAGTIWLTATLRLRLSNKLALTKSQNTGTRPTSPNTDAEMPEIWQDSWRRATFVVLGTITSINNNDYISIALLHSRNAKVHETNTNVQM